ncbi:MAG: hypothetical protein IGQ45_03390 [Cyanobacterium sp. T60_A2020_053]|nr:hypothetical protein [Cyanobacterium sp. T60_A2020_053]MBF2056271.1 hypothetical protein [Cyanobacterium sp. T60_A2020_053]
MTQNSDFSRVNLATCQIDNAQIIAHYQKESEWREIYSDDNLALLDDQTVTELAKNPIYQFKIDYPNNLSVNRSISIVTSEKGASCKKSVYPKKGIDKSQWLPYHHELFPLAQGKWMLVHEGEKGAEYGIRDGFVSTSLVGCAVNSKTDFTVYYTLFDEVIKHGINGLIYISDNDEAGLKKAIQFYLAYEQWKTKNNSVNLEVKLVRVSYLFSILGKFGSPSDDYCEVSKEIENHSNIDVVEFNRLLTLDLNNYGDNYTDEIMVLEDHYFPKEVNNSLVTVKNNDINMTTIKPDNITLTREILEKDYADRLRFNELKRIVELDNEEAYLDDLYLQIHKDYGIKINKQIAYDLAVMVAKENSYHPVKVYLDKCDDNFDEIDIKKLSTLLFGTNDPLYDEMLYRHLIGSVARVYKQGCKLDTALILQGKQGIRKSTFFKVLYGDEFFTDSVTGTDRDNLLVLHQHWCAELAEFETITGKKQSGELKAFLSKSVDTFREPYGRSTRTVKRQSVIVGSVNESEFLVDTTGNRRFWVIPVSQHIDIEKVKQYRDQIWAQAKKAYLAGEQWHLSYESQKMSDELNKQFLHTDSWDSSELDNYLYGFEEVGVSVRNILITHLGFEENQIKRGDEMRMSKILSSKGYEKKQKFINGKKQNLWFNLPLNQNFVGLKEKVGMVSMVGMSQSEQGFQTYQPPTNLTQNEKVGMGENQNLPTSNSEPTNLISKVGSSETIASNGIYQPLPTYQPFSQTTTNLNDQSKVSDNLENNQKVENNQNNDSKTELSMARLKLKKLLEEKGYKSEGQQYKVLGKIVYQSDQVCSIQSLTTVNEINTVIKRLNNYQSLSPLKDSQS